MRTIYPMNNITDAVSKRTTAKFEGDGADQKHGFIDDIPFERIDDHGLGVHLRGITITITKIGPRTRASAIWKVENSGNYCGPVLPDYPTRLIVELMKNTGIIEALDFGEWNVENINGTTKEFSSGPLMCINNMVFDECNSFAIPSIKIRSAPN